MIIIIIIIIFTIIIIIIVTIITIIPIEPMSNFSNVFVSHQPNLNKSRNWTLDRMRHVHVLLS